MMQNDLLQAGLHGSFVADGFDSLPAAALPLRTGGKLVGERLAVKDVFDVAGLRTGSGNLAWRDEQPVATRTALAVRALLEEGAQWLGKTVTDELTYSLAGVNAHYGTPVNPSDPARIPGGSSSGSVVAVAAGHADIALGTDCGGSVRLPASYCGVWGMRPTHGRIAADGCLTLAHSFDTVGWFARDARLLADTFEVLARSLVPADQAAFALHVPRNLLACVDPDVAARFEASLPALGERARFVAPEASLADWAQAFRVLQAAEIAQRYGQWAREHAASFGADVGARFAMSLGITREQIADAQRIRAEAIRAMAHALPERTYWLVPTVPGVAPRADASAQTLDHVRARSQQMLCAAGLAGLPQVSMPWTRFDGVPVGLSVIGARGADEGVLAAARAVHDVMRDAGV
ncbi:2-amino-5-chloromuconic acid deaminase [Paraburkholderia graminis C4D1M]|uniref:Amidase n=1 Tax=Paraburkholderia graminis (strain ATCC 700544 / DSM 17151 / LMG 18924 / NCIMB 13744 / C4D1M) TaxID=396598 RepID=B1G670_PARG4|nr:Amidase [Paraburkholderia graminis C4D1M]CAB3738659.1 2-amino-5-chloromuconic acid deaminase [Paraburkholderia graminis C4D1M]